MTLSNEVITVLISVSSALGTIIIKDIALSTLKQRRTGQRSLLQARVEQAYVPLEYLVFKLFQTDDTSKKEEITNQIGDILREHGHLLSDEASSSFYTLLEDENAGAHLLTTHFYTELIQLKDAYYRGWYTERPKSQNSTQINYKEEKHAIRIPEQSKSAYQSERNQHHARS